MKLQECIEILAVVGDEQGSLHRKAFALKTETLGPHVYLRALIELGNICCKDCFYCGIRSSNSNITRFGLDHDLIVKSYHASWDLGYRSFVLQSGELSNKNFIYDLDGILKCIDSHSNGNAHITLSCGEQSRETYDRWFESGADRYLLRIETSDPELYKKIHPDDSVHSFDVRIKALVDLKAAGFQTGTGILIGLPWQSVESIARDLLFIHQFDVDMIGMGPFIPHENTPLWEYRSLVPDVEDRINLTLNAIAALRLMFKDINIAATTALEVLGDTNKERAMLAGANVIMNNMTDPILRKKYDLYPGKNSSSFLLDLNGMIERCKKIGLSLDPGAWGDPLHYEKRRKDEK